MNLPIKWMSKLTTEKLILVTRVSKSKFLWKVAIFQLPSKNTCNAKFCLNAFGSKFTANIHFNLLKLLECKLSIHFITPVVIWKYFEITHEVKWPCVEIYPCGSRKLKFRGEKHTYVSFWQHFQAKNDYLSTFSLNLLFTTNMYFYILNRIKCNWIPLNIFWNYSSSAMKVYLHEFLGPVLLMFLRHVERIPANGIAAFKESCAPIG